MTMSARSHDWTHGLLLLPPILHLGLSSGGMWTLRRCVGFGRGAGGDASAFEPEDVLPPGQPQRHVPTLGQPGARFKPASGSTPVPGAVPRAVCQCRLMPRKCR